MAIQIALSYSTGIPDVLALSCADVLWFYEGIRPVLKRSSKPKKK